MRAVGFFLILFSVIIAPSFGLVQTHNDHYLANLPSRLTFVALGAGAVMSFWPKEKNKK